MNGATTRHPASTSCGATLRQVYAVSGKPCRHNAIGAPAEPQISARTCTVGVVTSSHCGSVTLHRVEFRDQPAIADLVQSHPHTGRGVGRRVLTDDYGLIDENQHHGVSWLGGHRGPR